MSKSVKYIQKWIPKRNITCHVSTFDKRQFISIELDSKRTVLDLKNEIERKKYVPVDQQKLICCGMSFEDYYPIYRLPLIINNNARIHLVLKNTK